MFDVKKPKENFDFYTQSKLKAKKMHYSQTKFLDQNMAKINVATWFSNSYKYYTLQIAHVVFKVKLKILSFT